MEVLRSTDVGNKGDYVMFAVHTLYFSAELAVLAATAVLTVYLPLPTGNHFHHAVLASFNNFHICCFLTDSNRVLVVY
jgi:hypothetical protein